MKVREDTKYVSDKGVKVLVVSATRDCVDYMELNTRLYKSMPENEFLEKFEEC